MRAITGRIVPAVVTLCCVALATATGAAERPEGKAAVVNGVPITLECYRVELKRLERQQGKKDALSGERLKKQALDNVIERELLFQEAKRRGLQASGEEVAREVLRLKEKVGGEGALDKTLERMGIEQGQLEEQLAKGMALQRLIDSASAAKSGVDEAEVARFYNEHPERYLQPLRFRLSHILVKTGPEADRDARDAARDKIEAIRKDLLSGRVFAALARERSDCYSARSGGDLGYFVPGQLSRKMEEDALSLKPGEVSGVVEDRYGFHLLMLTELKEPSVLPLILAAPQIRQELARQKDLNTLAPMLKRLRDQARVEVLLP